MDLQPAQLISPCHVFRLAFSGGGPSACGGGPKPAPQQSIAPADAAASGASRVACFGRGGVLAVLCTGLRRLPPLPQRGLATPADSGETVVDAPCGRRARLLTPVSWSPLWRRQAELGDEGADRDGRDVLQQPINNAGCAKTAAASRRELLAQTTSRVLQRFRMPVAAAAHHFESTPACFNDQRAGHLLLFVRDTTIPRLACAKVATLCCASRLPLQFSFRALESPNSITGCFRSWSNSGPKFVDVGLELGPDWPKSTEVG